MADDLEELARMWQIFGLRLVLDMEEETGEI